MGKLILSVCLSFVFLISLYGQDHLNVDLVATDTTEFSANDIWGYVDGNGIEYAIIGTRGNTEIYSLETAESPEKVGVIYGISTVWRDIKSFGNYVYIIADNAPDGLTIVDMSMAPDSISYEVFLPIFTRLQDSVIVDTLGSEIVMRDTVLVDYVPIDNCHNIYIDEAQARLFTAGCDGLAGGVGIYDLSTNPQAPTFIGATRLFYAHDAYAKGNLLVASEIYEGHFGLYDITNPTEPTLMATQETSNTFTHNAWFSDDSKYVFTTDERPNSFVDAYDISNPDSIIMLNSFQPFATKGRSVIPHNTHYLDGFLYTSWYTDGVVIIDANRPHNMIRVGQYDTYSGADGGGQGCWGAYPFLPSGLLLASDRNTGLYVLRPDVKQAAYLEGLALDMDTEVPINGVSVEIIDVDEAFRYTNANGEFATGVIDSGSYEILLTHPEYNDEYFTVELNNGVLKNATVYMSKLASPTNDVLFIQENIKVYPSPFVDRFEIELSQELSKSLERVDVRRIDGALVYSQTNFYGDNLKIESTDWFAGEYFVIFQTNNSRYTIPVVKQD